MDGARSPNQGDELRIQNFCRNTRRESDVLGDLGVDGRGTGLLKWSLNKEGVRLLTGLIWLRTGLRRGFFEHCNEPSGSTKYEFHRQLSNFKIFLR
jgi:hypothetical protein